MENTSKGYNILISVIALFLSVLSTVISLRFIGDLSFGMKSLCTSILILSPISVSWVVIALFRKS